MFLCDTAIEESLGELKGELIHTGSLGHGSRDTHHLLIPGGYLRDGSRKGTGICELTSSHYTLLWIEGTDAVVRGGFLLGIFISLTLLGADMEKNGALDILDRVQVLDQSLEIVTVPGTVVNKAQILEHGGLLLIDREPEEILHGEHDLHDGLSHHGKISR